MNQSSDLCVSSGPRGRWWGLSLLREMREDYLGFVSALKRQHGDLTRMRIVHEDAWDLFTPDLVREALVTHSEHLIRWERGIRIFAQIFGRSVLVTEGAAWQRQRRMLMPAFTPRRVAGYAGLMVEAARRLLDEVVPAGQSEATVEMGPMWSEGTMDVILRTLFGSAAQGDCQDAAWATQVLSDRAFQEMFWPLTLPDWLPLPGKAGKRRAQNVLRSLVGRQIEQRRQEGPGGPPREDLLHMLLCLRDEQTGQALSSQEVFDQCMVSFQAGHETTATGLLWWSHLMATHPQAQERARSEVDGMLKGAAPTAADLATLPWLMATLKEALRLYPPVAALMTRRTTAPITLGGRPVPKGAMLRITPWVIHRDPRWFPQPERFKPERFLDDEVPIPKGAWMPFGVGPRVCIGQQFALLEMMLLAALMLQRYVLEPVAGPEVEPELHVTLRPKMPIRLRLSRRSA